MDIVQNLICIFINIVFALLIKVVATICVPFTCQFLHFYCFSKSIKRIEYYQIMITLYPQNSLIFPSLPYVKLNAFDHTGNFAVGHTKQPCKRKLLQ